MQSQPPPSRRDFLRQAGNGFGALAAAWLLQGEAGAADAPGDPLAPRPPHFPTRARRVISLFMHGGPSHLETFDPKPDLQRLAGRPLPDSFGPVATRRKVAHNPLLATRRTFRKSGQSGIEVSDFLPHTSALVDDLAVIRSCWADSVNHPQAVYQMNTGSTLMGRPSLGSWVGYGLGTENRDLPAFVVLPDPLGGIKGGPPAYGAGYLPASYQGTVVRGGDSPILDLRPPEGMTPARQRKALDLIAALNARHLEARGEDNELEARIRAYELAYRMQSAAPDAVDLSGESEETKALYGLDQPKTAEFGARCLLARRLVERGVRFVQLYSGDVNGWDAHDDVEKNHAAMCARTDKPVAALLIDLKRRGLLDDTLVIWGGEFGRMPMSEGGKGRDHNPHGFSCWLAGAGVKGGTVHGSTDAVGLRAERDRVHVHDLHATILHLMGLDHARLTFPHNGRDERLTETSGRVIKEILGVTLAIILLALIAPAVDDTAHWAFAPPKRVEPPAVREAEWPRNVVDRFVLARLEAEGLRHAPEADRPTLLRRLSFDLIGLPPSPEEVAAFEADRAPDAYEKQVDRLLSSPHHGERQAQHWLDLARYADSDGFEFDEARPDAWRYRDWVVKAINADLPYDRFVALQLAGDELAGDDPDAVVATGFNRCYPDMVNLNDQGLRRQHALDDIAETTALAFLGLTMGCARCHDHKFDPITQVDFYRLQAFFTPARFRDDYPIPGPTGPGKARVIDEGGPEPPPTYLRRRGEFQAKGPEVQPGFPAVLDRAEPEIHPRTDSSGRRSSLAAWLTRPGHPLTARVVVNRIWQGHFGRGIVATPSDFGLMGEAPSHPELLDQLALELVDRGWSLKAIHRLIVTSATYRQATRKPEDEAERLADPDDRLLWRQNRRRLDGEAIRDALLAASGRLDRSIGGPCVFPELPVELTRLSGKGKAWPVSPRAEDRDRRSLYVFIRRNLRFPFFEAFDRPDANASCPRRATTTIAPQALSLLNGELALGSARALADRAGREARPEPSALVDRAYRLALGRGPDPGELRLALSFLEGDDPSSLADLCLALVNLNEFIYLD